MRGLVYCGARHFADIYTSTVSVQRVSDAACYQHVYISHGVAQHMCVISFFHRADKGLRYICRKNACMLADMTDILMLVE